MVIMATLVVMLTQEDSGTSLSVEQVMWLTQEKAAPVRWRPTTTSLFLGNRVCTLVRCRVVLLGNNNQ